MLKYKLNPIHHTICYVAPNETRSYAEDFMKGNFAYDAQNIFGISDTTMWHQCNGIVGGILNRTLLMVIPVDYLPIDEPTYVDDWLKLCAEMGFKGMKNEGIFNMNFINPTPYTSNRLITEALRNMYQVPVDSKGYLISIAPGVIQKDSLAYVSLLRTLYVNCYRGIIEEYKELLKKYPNEDKFKVFVFSIHTYPQRKTYTEADNGGYHFATYTTKSWDNYCYNKYFTFDKFINRRKAGNNLNVSANRRIKCTTSSEMIEYFKQMNDTITKLYEEKNLPELEKILNKYD